MPEAIPFYTGKQLSADAFVTVAGNTAVASMTAAQLAAKNRVWTLAVGEVAYLPTNVFRASLVVDATQASAAATIRDTSGTQIIRKVTAATAVEFDAKLAQVGPGTMDITAGAGGCVVTERSYI